MKNSVCPDCGSQARNIRHVLHNRKGCINWPLCGKKHVRESRSCDNPWHTEMMRPQHDTTASPAPQARITNTF